MSNDGKRAVVIVAHHGPVECHLALAQRLEVTIVDPGIARRPASYGNAGVLAACSIVPVTTPGLVTKAPFMLLDPNSPLFVRFSYLPKIVPWLFRYLKHANATDAARIAKGWRR